MNYAIVILRSAQKQLADIQRRDRDRLYATIRDPAHDPRPRGCKKLTGRHAWRIRLGEYRIIYEISDDQMSIRILAAGHRRDIYR